jgi:phage terminase small subunit
LAHTLTPFPAPDGGNGLPSEPDWPSIFADVLDLEVAHREWATIVREMGGAQTLAPANGHAVKRLVEFRVQYERAARLVAEQGTIIPARRTQTPRSNPYWAVMRQAAEAIRSLESRARLGAGTAGQGKDSAAHRAGAAAVRRVPQAALT